MSEDQALFIKDLKQATRNLRNTLLTIIGGILVVCVTIGVAYIRNVENHTVNIQILQNEMKTVKANYISKDDFAKIVMSFEYQAEEYTGIKDGDMHKIEEVKRKYDELRRWILTSTNSATRGAGITPGSSPSQQP